MCTLCTHSTVPGHDAAFAMLAVPSQAGQPWDGVDVESAALT